MICLFAEAENTPSLDMPELPTPGTCASTATVMGHVLMSRIVKTVYSNQSPNCPYCLASLPRRTCPQPPKNELGSGICAYPSEGNAHIAIAIRRRFTPVFLVTLAIAIMVAPRLRTTAVADRTRVPFSERTLAFPT